MKAKLLLVLLIIGLHYTATAQVTHDYKPNCCRLAGATFTSEKSCYCAGCAAVDKKNAEAKAAEDKRVQEVAAKKVEEKKQKAIAEAKKQKEELEKKAKDSKANVVHLGSGGAKNEKIEKVSINVLSKKVKEERLKIVVNRIQEKYYDGRDFESSLVDKNNETIITIKNVALKYTDGYGSESKIPTEDVPNVYCMEERLEIGYDEFRMYKYNLINNKGQKLFIRDDIVEIRYCGSGYFLLKVPISLGRLVQNDYSGKSYYYLSSFQYILYDYYKKEEYLLPYWTDYMDYAVVSPNYSRKLSDIGDAALKAKINNIPNNENIVVVVDIKRQGNDPSPPDFYRTEYYFDKKDLKWKFLSGF